MLVDDFFQQLQVRTLHIVTDTLEINEAVRAHGFGNTSLFPAFDFKANHLPVLWLISDYETQYQMRDLWGETGGIVIQVTESKAGGDAKTLDYTLRHLLAVKDYTQLLDKRTEYYDKLLSYNAVNVHTPNASLECYINEEEVEIASHERELESGHLYSLAEFFKASIINMSHPISTFRLEGEVTFDALLHQTNFPELKQATLPRMQKFHSLALQGNNRLSFTENRIIQMILGGVNVTDELLALTSEREWETTATELAIGLVDIVPDWHLNTLFHQCVSGVHIGMGMGEKIPFIDFIAKQANFEFL